MKKKKYQVGDVFAVPIGEGRYGLGHVAGALVLVPVGEGPHGTMYDTEPTLKPTGRRKYGAVCAVFAAQAVTPAELLAKFDEAGDPLTILVVTEEELETGVWPILGNRPRDYSRFRVPTDGKGVSHTSNTLEYLLAAYHGLDVWDRWHDPKCNDKLLIPGTRLPSTIRYKRDLTKDELIAFHERTNPKPPPPVTEGPALVTLQIVYPGDGLPSTDLVRRRQEMERRLEAEGAGEVEGAESGAGVMEVYLRTDEVRRTLPLVEKIAAEMGFADDMLIETAPLEDEDDEEHDDDA